MFKRSLQLILVTCLITGSSWAAEDPFVGDWKLNPSKSNLTDQMKVESLGANKYSFDFVGDGSARERIVVDGTDQPGNDGTTLSVSVEGPDAWKVVRKKDGRTIIIGNWKLSRDGNTLTDNFNAISPNGSTSTVDYVYQRKGGGPGFAGMWVSTSEGLNFVLVLQIRPYETNGLSILDSSTGKARKVKFDSKDYRREDEHTLDFTDKKANGEIADTQQLQLSSDLKTLTMTTHITGRRDPQVLMFDRQ